MASPAKSPARNPRRCAWARNPLAIADAGIVRNRAKIDAAVVNARCSRRVKEEYGSFARYLWGFTEAEALSKDLKRRGFKFVGSTIMYAFMQAVGMVNDHQASCFRRREIDAKN
jgi:DNA-3-methyladenine glycosylase I